MESVNFLQTGKLIEWIRDRDGDIIHVTPDKRSVLDFYKNNIIHFFLLPALIARALRAGVTLDRLGDDVWWWLELYRWEFALPERDELTVELDRWLAHLRQVEVLREQVPDRDHAVLRTTAGILDNFREAYWVTVRTVALQHDWPLSQKSLVQRLRRAFSTGLLLGDVHKPEANSTVTYQNALSRLQELRCLAVDSRTRGSREPRLEPGAAFDQLRALAERLRP
jgi:glycerol-3-phosphate O-acyltransferase